MRDAKGWEPHTVRSYGGGSILGRRGRLPCFTNVCGNEPQIGMGILTKRKWCESGAKWCENAPLIGRRLSIVRKRCGNGSDVGTALPTVRKLASWRDKVPNVGSAFFCGRPWLKIRSKQGRKEIALGGTAQAVRKRRGAASKIGAGIPIVREQRGNGATRR